VSSHDVSWVLLVSLAAALGGCEESARPASVTRERSQAIETGPQSPAAVATPTPTPAAASAAPRPSASHKALCQGQMREGKALPKLKVSRADEGSDALPKQALESSGRWTWVNFWAAWCAPCKEEIPRLKAWEKALSRKRLQVLFVSLDDDPRQLRQFLESGGLRDTYWLREGKERDDWLSEAALDADPELPFHLLVDPDNRVRCRIQGAVEDRDLPDLIRLLDGK
jgi:thiol-disulfide isomerase/thioredoxin